MVLNCSDIFPPPLHPYSRDLLRHKCSFRGITINDTIRFEVGDGPVCQFEAGQQKGGNFACWGCPMHKNDYTDTVKVLEAQTESKEVVNYYCRVPIFI